MLGSLTLEPRGPEQWLLHRTWLDSWSGIGHVVAGMARQGHRLHLTNIDAETGRATFSGYAMIAAEGFGADRTAWGAVQRAAWEALKKIEATL
jgi:hypothetical protein